jgi:hypothetical protein
MAITRVDQQETATIVFNTGHRRDAKTAAVIQSAKCKFFYVGLPADG